MFFYKTASYLCNLCQVAHNNNNNNSTGGGVGAKHTSNGHHHNIAANNNTNSSSSGVGAGERLTLLGYSDQEHGLVLPSYEEALRSATGDIALLDGDTLFICREAGSGGHHSRRGAEQGHYRHQPGAHRWIVMTTKLRYNCNIKP